jgi:hypothetical protein
VTSDLLRLPYQVISQQSITSSPLLSSLSLHLISENIFSQRTAARKPRKMRKQQILLKIALFLKLFMFSAIAIVEVVFDTPSQFQITALLTWSKFIFQTSAKISSILLTLEKKNWVYICGPKHLEMYEFILENRKDVLEKFRILDS